MGQVNFFQGHLIRAVSFHSDTNSWPALLLSVYIILHQTSLREFSSEVINIQIGFFRRGNLEIYQVQRNLAFFKPLKSFDQIISYGRLLFGTFLATIFWRSKCSSFPAIFKVILDVTLLLSKRNTVIEKEEGRGGKHNGLFMRDHGHLSNNIPSKFLPLLITKKPHYSTILYGQSTFK